MRHSICWQAFERRDCLYSIWYSPVHIAAAFKGVTLEFNTIELVAQAEDSECEEIERARENDN